ncbi:hypothetical protein MOQ_006561 [Trypanosoma cruzi marinkellei]|uniref:Uncharacterized protein n=1 Tax=Trypanosoma cruzi marinkellei TaxID=85056 RepID=K2M3U4_TRYCR|nr:hypothetical protein MOQ_006561 [Trypanosoma cruzi marinkellei]
MSHDVQQQQPCMDFSLTDSEGHDAMAALHRLEDAAATLHSESRKLHRAILLQQRLASRLLSGDTDATGAADSFCPVNTRHLWPVTSQYEMEAQRIRMSSTQHRDVAFLLRQRATLGELWERLVVRTWYKRVVLVEFYERVMKRLNDFDRRLQRASLAVRPERRMCGVTPTALFSLEAAVRRQTRESADTAVVPTLRPPIMSTAAATEGENQNNNNNDDNNEEEDEGELCVVKRGEELWVRRQRQLRTIVHLSTVVVREYTEQQTMRGGCDMSNNNREDHHCVGVMDASVPFTLEQLAAVMQHIFTVTMGRDWPFIGDSPHVTTQAQSQTEVLVHILSASPLLRFHMEQWFMYYFRPQDRLGLYRHFAQAILNFMQESSRATRNLLVTRRHQQERDEARWQSMRARAVAALYPLSPDATTVAALPSVASVVNEGTHLTDDVDHSDIPIETSECVLWLVVNALRRQQKAESVALDPTGN